MNNRENGNFQLEALREAQQAYVDSSINIKDEYNRKIALRAAAGKGTDGEADPIHQCIRRSTNWLPVSKHLGALGQVNQALDNLEKKYSSAELRKAAKNGDGEFVKAFIAYHRDNLAVLNNGDSKGETALHMACSRGNVGIAHLLLEHGADKDQGRTSDGATPLHLAAIEGCLDVVRLLVGYRADVNKLAKDKEPILQWAADKGHDKVVACLTDNGAKVSSSLPLVGAAINGHLSTVDVLISRGADVNANIEGYPHSTPLAFALQFGHHDVAKRLLADPKIEVPEWLSISKALKESIFNDIKAISDIKKLKAALEDATGKGYRGETHPHYKIIRHARFGSTSEDSGTLGEMNKMLGAIKENEKAKQQSQTYTGTKLINAAKENNIQYVRNCIAQNNPDLLNEKDDEGKTALYVACKEGHTEIIDLLVDAKVNVNLAQKKGNTPLHAAILSKKLSEDDKR